VALGEVGGVGSDLVGGDAVLHVFPGIVKASEVPPPPDGDQLPMERPFRDPPA